MKSLALSLLSTGLLAATPAIGGESHFYTYAKVRHVTPVYEYTRVKQPRQVCHNRHQPRKKRHHPVTGTVTGAIVGGAIGHDLTHSSSYEYHPVTRCKKLGYTVSQQSHITGYNVE